MRRRIAVSAVASATLAILIFLVPLAAAVVSLNVGAVRSDLEREALNAALMVDPAFSTRDVPEMPVPAAGTELGLYDSTGHLLAGTGPRTADAATAKILGLKPAPDSPDWVVSAVAVTGAEQTTGAIRAAGTVATVWQRVAAIWAILLLAGTLAVAVAWLLARRSARQISAPIERLAQASVDLGNGDFDVRLPETGVGELDLAGAALQSAAASLDDLLTRERLLASNVSHQLRTPLAGLRAVLEAALADPATDLRIAVEHAIGHADVLNSTIDDVIALTRGSAPRWPAVDLTPLLHRAAAGWTAALAARLRPLRVEIKTALPPSSVAPSAVIQILDVLLDNALQHGLGPVTLTGRSSDAAIAIDVADDGGSIPDDSIFGRGVSFNGGSGVGLALARRLAEDQGGRLLLSRRTPYTQFTLLLPVRADHP
ncbi:HAMP domain-containing histidine kinase [Paenarthrobacter sp. Z7-10]|uniref:sensor histidine kinase n=1 Tax=Paenarthrobacter sp. Z7-10 TaxID=2787635 RepID=UPI0022A90534|nr:HAMP domain-containing sensor histidine kinase [Paenarthrobacter sp. Z7-10]MCZ2403987.1 HAMP domain-containing histidine kinase [Paenarthrobacter sp. Z7-10]